MYSISAADAVSPAIQRTREFLFRPFNWGTYLKLGLVALITEGFGSNFNSSSHGGGGGSPSHGPVINSPLSSYLGGFYLIAGIAALVLAAILAAWLFYLFTRLRFAFFHCLVENTKQIRPGWRLYKTQATRFFWMNIAVGFCFLMAMVVIALPFVAGFVKLFHGTPPGGHPDWGLMLALALPLIPIILLLMLAGLVTDLILRDFMMPHYALESATAGAAWGEVWSNIKAEKGQFFVYAILRVILPILAAIGLFIVLLIPGAVLAGALGMVEYGIHTGFAGATGASTAAGIFLEVFFGVVAFGFALLLSICLGGPLSTGIREYALIFYGGRYPTLGDKLFPVRPAASVGGNASVV
jgi:hypothetical protein